MKEIAEQLSKLTGRKVEYDAQSNKLICEGGEVYSNYDSIGRRWRIKFPDGKSVKLYYDPLSAQYFIE